MTYLSMRMREIRAEEARRKEPKLYLGIDFGWPEHGELFPLPMSRPAFWTRDYVDYRGRAG